MGIWEGEGKGEREESGQEENGEGGPVLKFDIRKGLWREGLPDISFANFQKYCRCELAYFC